MEQIISKQEIPLTFRPVSLGSRDGGGHMKTVKAQFCRGSEVVATGNLSKMDEKLYLFPGTVFRRDGQNLTLLSLEGLRLDMTSFEGEKTIMVGKIKPVTFRNGQKAWKIMKLSYSSCGIVNQ